MYKNINILICFTLLISMIACHSSTKEERLSTPTVDLPTETIIQAAHQVASTTNSLPTTTANKSKNELINSPHSTKQHIYPWKENIDDKSRLIHRFPVPEGFERIAYPDNDFANWLRHLPLKAKNSPVKYYNGQTKTNDVHEAVIDIDIGKRDLQQCADAIMRLKAEYHFSKKDYKNIHFNYTSGHLVSFDDWRRGKKPIVKGNKVLFSSSTGQVDNSYRNFKKYLQQIFNYAGTASLEKELYTVSIKDIQSGDVFIQGGFPGHAVIVIDVAKNVAGAKIFMLAQSYMPAQNIHLLKNTNQPASSPWYSIDFGENLYTPEWTFHRNQLRRFNTN